MEAKKQEQPTGSSSKPAGKKRKKQIKKENDKLKTDKGSSYNAITSYYQV